ncbi:MAG: hypothetical protein E7773_00240 [Sphingomonas sp.]|uniref:hypothetical protein n=1 Tax=Sphingomonas sp. TaxID=28214 RepID=UPI001200A7D9|nr:hypothetical protein [Sphingomonas sp.]THD38227.1 MAG: hypothetical protein E7773_00240 [Sphingomonas sp.]
MRLLILAFATVPVFAAAQTRPAPVVAGRPPLPVPARCAVPLADYHKILKRLSQSMAEGAYPDGKTEKLRSIEEQNLTLLAQTADLESCGGRPLPLSPRPYLLAAMKCERARRASKAPASPPACDQANWKPYTE